MEKIDSTSQYKNTILIVDDNDDNLHLLRAIFESSVFSIYTATSVSSARTLLKKFKNSIDLVLSDISMPVETGFDLVQWMRDPQNEHEDVPVLLITAALPEDENRIKGLAMGAVDYIVRPINNQELILRVRNALAHFKQFRTLRATLESSEDLAMTGRILAAANHEIRNLVHIIDMTSDQALAEAERGHEMKIGSKGFQSLSSLTKMTKLLSNISHDLNSHIQAEKIKTRAVSLRSVIDDVMIIVCNRVGKNKIEQPFLPVDLYFHADETRVKQILINFILNAVDGIQEKGSEQSGRIIIRVTENGPEKLQIRVEDNGIGLPVEQKRYIFQPFHTTKAIRGGKGLGLWLCARLAIAMGGKIWLESNGPGKGATSVLELVKCNPEVHQNIDISQYLMD